jgi:hypothetical protein
MNRINMELKKIINWSGLSEGLDGNRSAIRADRVNTKYAKQVKSLKKHIESWAKENNIELN